MSDNVSPQKARKLIVVLAFDRSEDGELGPAFDPIQFDSEERAIRQAKAIAGNVTVMASKVFVPTEEKETTQ